MKGGGKSYSGYTREISNNYSSAPETDDCDFINFTTELQNLQFALSGCVQGDVLKVVLMPNDVVAASDDQGICGYITSVETTELIICLKKGKEFKAVILNITSTFCEVRVRPLN